MSGNRQRLAARDYKHAGRDPSPFDLAQYRQFAIGLAIGLAVTLVVWLHDHRVQPRSADDLTEVSKPDTRTDKAETDDVASDDPADNYDFYEKLSKSEVTVPELDHGARRDLPDEPVALPGAYVLQVGSYRNRPDAERLRATLAKLGVEANIQHVTIDTDEWDRVRIGPISDLTKLNATRRQLRSADIDAVIYRVGD